MGKMAELLVFAVSGLRCALPLPIIERVLRAVEIVPVPKAPDIVMGLLNVQGRVMPVLNIRKLFRLPETEIGLEDQIIIASTASRPVAVLVDRVIRVAQYNAEDVIAPEEFFPGIEYLEGLAKLPDGIIFIYNLDRFFSPEVTSRILSLSPPGVSIPTDT